MRIQTYPLLLSIYKGEGRILIVPIIDHIGGYSVDSDWFVCIENIQDATKIGKSLLEAVRFVENSPLEQSTRKERELKSAWKKNSKYKSWMSFWKNNNMAYFKCYSEGLYEVLGMLRSEKQKGGYGKCIKKVELPLTTTADIIGRTVIEVFEAMEEYYGGKLTDDSISNKSLQLLDDTLLMVKHPADKHFEDAEDGGAAEIYQCYSYMAQEGGESLAEFFLGIAPELDCNIEPENVRSVWEEMNGKAECLEMKMCEHEVFKYRAEMINKNMHKISYLVQQQEDLLLECSMELHQPGRRKKLDEKLTTLFEEFVRNCKR